MAAAPPDALIEQLHWVEDMVALATGILIVLLFLVPIVYVIMISLESFGQFLAHPRAPRAAQRGELRLSVATR